MNTVQEYLDIIKDYGFDQDLYFDGLDDTLCSVSISDKSLTIHFQCRSTEEWDDYLSTLSQGDEFEWDLNQHEVYLAAVSGQICTEANFYDGKKEGIILTEAPTEEDYHPHLLSIENLIKAIEIQRYPSLHMLNILRSHIKNTEILQEKLYPILKKYEYVEYYNSLLDDRTSSDLIVMFNHPNSYTEISYRTDCFDGKLIVEDFRDVDFSTITKEEFEKLFIDRILKDHKTGEISLDFEYLFTDDPRNNRNTKCAVYQCLDVIRRKGPIYCFDADPKDIPEKYMHYYTDAIKIIKKHNG